MEVLTFVFSDIEGSTALLQSLGADRYGAVLADHHRLLSDATVAHGGLVEATEGDGAFIIFRSASAAVAAALDAQIALASHAWPMDEPLGVRMGIHTGEAEQRDSVLVGLAIHEAARISAAAHGGQVLVSSTTSALAGGELPDGAALVDLGCFQLKDLPGDHRLLQLHHPALPGEVRAPRVSEAARTNLREPRSAFVGRAVELAEVRALLGEHRLVAIVGSGGAGKTRLALEVARANVGEGMNGVWMVELATRDGSDDLMTVIASALTLPSGVDPLVIVAQRLGDGAQLLILDNCEHLLDAAAQVAISLSDACPLLRLLVTSREPLSVAGERVWRIPSLSLPDPTAGTDAIAQSDAVRLFVERARSASATITDAQLDDIAAICRRLDGIPLAIELAAARARALPTRQLLDRLDNVFPLLVSSVRDTVPRQQTLRATMEWSHDLLSEPERILLRRLAVFAGSFALEAIEVVCSDDQVDALFVVDLLTSLVDRSMVVVDDIGASRYRLLESVRQFAMEQLEEAEEVVMLHQRHLRWCTEVAVAFRERIVNGDSEVLRRGDTESPNMDAALAWAAEHDLPGAEELAANLALYWFTRSRMHEAVRWLRCFGDDDSVASPHRLRLLRAAAMALREAGGAPDEIRSLALRGRALADRLGDPTSGAYLVGTLALLAGPERLSLAREAIELARRSGDAIARSLTLSIAALVLTDEGRFDEAAQRLDELRVLADPSTNAQWRATVFIGEADLYLVTDRPADAVTAARAALALTTQEFNEQPMGIGLIALGAASLDVPDLEAAHDAYTELFRLGRRVSEVATQGIALAGLAAVAAERSQFETSARVLGAALAIPRTPGARPTTRRGYELAEHLDRSALADRFDTLVAEGALLAPEEAAALVGLCP